LHVTLPVAPQAHDTFNFGTCADSPMSAQCHAGGVCRVGSPHRCPLSSMTCSVSCHISGTPDRPAWLDRRLTSSAELRWAHRPVRTTPLTRRRSREPLWSCWIQMPTREVTQSLQRTQLTPSPIRRPVWPRRPTYQTNIVFSEEPVTPPAIRPGINVEPFRR
jgi:hypothetical protein